MCVASISMFVSFWFTRFIYIFVDQNTCNFDPFGHCQSSQNGSLRPVPTKASSMAVPTLNRRPLLTILVAGWGSGPCSMCLRAEWSDMGWGDEHVLFTYLFTNSMQFYGHLMNKPRHTGSIAHGCLYVICPHLFWGLLDFMSSCPPPSSFLRSSPDLNCKL